MIARIWRGWTNVENADEYENLLRQNIFPAIEAKQIKGFQKISLLKLDIGEEVEFMTIMLFADIEAVKAFAGEDYKRAYVPDDARKILSRYEEFSKHFEVLE